jgi:hypothetical protein
MLALLALAALALALLAAGRGTGQVEMPPYTVASPVAPPRAARTSRRARLCRFFLRAQTVFPSFLALLKPEHPPPGSTIQI